MVVVVVCVYLQLDFHCKDDDLLLLKCQREQRLTTTPSTTTTATAVPTIRVDEPDTDDDDDDDNDDVSDNDNDDDKDDLQSVQDTGMWLILIRFYVTMLCMNFLDCVRHFLTKLILSRLFASKSRQASTRFSNKLVNLLFVTDFDAVFN